MDARRESAVVSRVEQRAPNSWTWNFPERFTATRACCCFLSDGTFVVGVGPFHGNPSGSRLFWIKPSQGVEEEILIPDSFFPIVSVSAWYDAKKRVNLAVGVAELDFPPPSTTFFSFYRQRRSTGDYQNVDRVTTRCLESAVGIEGTGQALIADAFSFKILSLRGNHAVVSESLLDHIIYPDSWWMLQKCDWRKQLLYFVCRRFESLMVLPFRVHERRLLFELNGATHPQTHAIDNCWVLFTDATEAVTIRQRDGSTLFYSLSGLLAPEGTAPSASSPRLFPYDAPADAVDRSRYPPSSTLVPLADEGVAMIWNDLCCVFAPSKGSLPEFVPRHLFRAPGPIREVHENPLDGSLLLLTASSATLCPHTQTLLDALCWTLALHEPRDPNWRDAIPSELVLRVYLLQETLEMLKLQRSLD